MIPLRYLVQATLNEATDVLQDNGLMLHEEQEIGNYNVRFYELNDEISAHIYGANLNRMYRIQSPQRKIEKFMATKTNTSPDNISNYFVYIDERKYRVVSVKMNWIDLELY